MKMSPATFTLIEVALDGLPIDMERERARYEARDIPRADCVKDIDTRFRWDLYWAANRSVDNALSDATTREQLTNAHINTALRQLVPPLKERTR